MFMRPQRGRETQFPLVQMWFSFSSQILYPGPFKFPRASSGHNEFSFKCLLMVVHPQLPPDVSTYSKHNYISRSCHLFQSQSSFSVQRLLFNIPSVQHHHPDKRNGSAATKTWTVKWRTTLGSCMMRKLTKALAERRSFAVKGGGRIRKINIQRKQKQRQSEKW